MQIEQLKSVVAELLQITNNPVDMEIIGLEGRGEILRNYIKHSKLPEHKIVPDRNELLTRSANQKFEQLVGARAEKLQTDPARLIQIAQGAVAQQAA